MVKKVVRSSSKKTSVKSTRTTKPKVAKKKPGTDRATSAYNRLRKSLRE